MPPAIYVSSDAGEIVDQAIRLQIPAISKVRDTLIAIVAEANANDGPDPDLLEAGGWTVLATHVGATHTMNVLRRERELGDPSYLDIGYIDAIASGIGALVVFRNLDNSATAVAASATSIAASTDFVCPSQTLTRYSDLYLGVVLVSSAAVAVDHPLGIATERIDMQYGGKTIEAFSKIYESTGATGTLTATTAANQSGIAMSLALAADNLKGFGLSFSNEPIGAPGLPSEGV